MEIRSGKRLALVIDDVLHSQNLFCLLFEELGWRPPTVVSRGEDGIKLLKASSQFDIVILDIKLPGMDGWEVFRRIQKLSTTPPIVMVTGNEDSTLIDKARERGVDGFIYKNKLTEDGFNLVVENAIKQHEKKTR